MLNCRCWMIRDANGSMRSRRRRDAWPFLNEFFCLLHLLNVVYMYVYMLPSQIYVLNEYVLCMKPVYQKHTQHFVHDLPATTATKQRRCRDRASPSQTTYTTTGLDDGGLYSLCVCVYVLCGFWCDLSSATGTDADVKELRAHSHYMFMYRFSRLDDDHETKSMILHFT